MWYTHCSAHLGMDIHLPGSGEIKKRWCYWGKKKRGEIQVCWGGFRWLVSDASVLCLTSIFWFEREKEAAGSVLPLPIVPARLSCWHLLAESERERISLSCCCACTKFCASRINQDVSHLCNVEVLNLHMGCEKRLFDQRFRLCADFFFNSS